VAKSAQIPFKGQNGSLNQGTLTKGEGFKAPRSDKCEKSLQDSNVLSVVYCAMSSPSLSLSCSNFVLFLFLASQPKLSTIKLVFGIVYFDVLCLLFYGRVWWPLY